HLSLRIPALRDACGDDGHPGGHARAGRGADRSARLAVPRRDQHHAERVRHDATLMGRPGLREEVDAGAVSVSAPVEAGRLTPVPRGGLSAFPPLCCHETTAASTWAAVAGPSAVHRERIGPMAAQVTDQYRRAPEPKQLLLFPGTAHGQHIFATDQ